MTSRSILTRAYLRYLGASKKPVIIGPFRSELGFEVLYWIPFVRWACRYAKIAPERRIILSRGGMGHFYHGPTESFRQADLYRIRGVEPVRVANQLDYERRKVLKQIDCTPWDRAVCSEAASQVGVSRYHILHPSWMYWLFEEWWEERAPFRLIADHTRYEDLPVPNLPEGTVLPPRFIAVRFYDRQPTFPFQHDHVRQLATDIVQRLASRMPVVLLNQPDLCADDHVDLQVSGPNILTLTASAPDHNFAVQAAILARCDAFVGTYGGVAQWALRYGKPVLCFYEQFAGTALAHRTVSERIAQDVNVPFECSDIRAMKLWNCALNEIAHKAAA